MKAHSVHFKILDETEDWIVIDKPAGLLMHPTKPGGPPTLWDGLRDLLAYEVINKGQISLINRLDRETSGVVLVCKTAASARIFAMAMQEGQIRKTYHALVYGRFPEDSVRVNAPILRIGEKEPSNIWLKRGIHSEGDIAETRVEIISRHRRSKSGEAFSQVLAYPVTGRTHQIRVHLASLGHPVIGDKIYGPDEMHYLQFIEQGWNEQLQKTLWMSRQALHSRVLEVTIREKTYRWEASLPEDMEKFIGDSVPEIPQ